MNHPNPISHTNDPGTSAESANRVTRSGARGANCQHVLTLVYRFPRSTAAELERAQDGDVRLDLTEVRRRLTDLLAAGRVAQGKARKCRVRNTKMVTWTATN